MIFRLLLIFSAFLLPFAFLADDSPSPKQKNRIKYTRNHQDIQEIIDKLREKFTEALGPERPLTLPWNQVEIVGGWPSSVYLLEPNYWCKHDIEALKEAIDSVEIRPLTRKPKKTRPADELHSQLMTECKRLNLVKEKSSVIDWRRIAANVDGLRLTNTYYRKWNAQDRLMVQRLINNLEQFANASQFPKNVPVHKNPAKSIRENLSKGWKQSSKLKKRKAAEMEEETGKIEADGENYGETVGPVEESACFVEETPEDEDADFVEKVQEEAEFVEDIEENEVENNINHRGDSSALGSKVIAAFTSKQIEENTYSQILPSQSSIINGIPDETPIEHQEPPVSPSTLEMPTPFIFSQYMDIFSGLIEDSHLESIINDFKA